MLAARSADIVPKRMVRPRAQVCSGTISYVGEDELSADIENLKLALDNASAEQAFMTTISPSNLELYYENRYYASDEQYLAALADAMHVEPNHPPHRNASNNANTEPVEFVLAFREPHESVPMTRPPLYSHQLNVCLSAPEG